MTENNVTYNLYLEQRSEKNDVKRSSMTVHYKNYKMTVMSHLCIILKMKISSPFGRRYTVQWRTLSAKFSCFISFPRDELSPSSFWYRARSSVRAETLVGATCKYETKSASLLTRQFSFVSLLSIQFPPILVSPKSSPYLFTFTTNSSTSYKQQQKTSVRHNVNRSTHR